MSLATDLSTTPATPVSPSRVLHVGCGAPHPDKLPEAFFPRDAWAEVRLDIDPDVAPDIVASITDMTVVPTASVGTNRIDRMTVFDYNTGWLPAGVADWSVY